MGGTGHADGRPLPGGGWTDSEYRYDSPASRAGTLESTRFTCYDWDSIKVLQEKTGGGTVTDRQVHGHACIVSVGDTRLKDNSGTACVPVADQVGTIWNLQHMDAAAASRSAVRRRCPSARRRRLRTNHAGLSV